MCKDSPKNGSSLPDSPLEKFHFRGKNKSQELLSITAAGLLEWSHKNEKDSPPIHSREQSLKIISMRGD